MNKKLDQYQLLLIYKTKFGTETLRTWWASGCIINLFNEYKSQKQMFPENTIGYYILDTYNNKIVEFHKD